MNGVTAHVLEAGQGKPVVLLHGLGSIADEIIRPFLPLASRYRLIAPDRPGYGMSKPLPGEHMATAMQAEWLGSLLRERSAEKPLIIAHSIASLVALHYAIRGAMKPSGILLTAPFCLPTRPAAMPLLRLAMLPVVGPLFRRYIVPRLARRLGPGKLAAAFAPEPVPENLREFPFELAARPEAFPAMARELWQYNDSAAWIAARLQKIQCPITVIAGANDEIARCSCHAEPLTARLPNARFIRISDAGHMLHHTRIKILESEIANAARSGANRAIG